MACKQINTIFLNTVLTVLFFFAWTTNVCASDEDADIVDDEVNYSLSLESLEHTVVCPKISKADLKEVCKTLKKPLIVGLFTGKFLLGITQILFFVEHMNELNKLKGSLPNQHDKNCSEDCINNVVVLDQKANGAILTDILVGMSTCLGAPLSDLLALSAYFCGHPDAALIMLCLSSGCNLVASLSAAGNYAVLTDGLQKNLAGLSDDVRATLENAIAKTIKIIVPTSTQGLPVMIATCCAFWRRKLF